MILRHTFLSVSHNCEEK